MRETDLSKEFARVATETQQTSHTIRWNKVDKIWSINFPQHYLDFGGPYRRGATVRIKDETLEGLFKKAIRWMRHRDRKAKEWRRRDTDTRRTPSEAF